MRVEPRKLGVGERSGLPDEKRFLVVYVCPNPDCGSYYGSSSMPPLETQENRSPIGGSHVTGTRDQCPTCRTPREKRYAQLVPKTDQAKAEKVVKEALDLQTAL
jgi:hypothetical protein